MIKLTLTEKGGEPKVLTFDKDEITIGRVSGNDIVLAKGNISKRHTRLTKRDGGDRDRRPQEHQRHLRQRPQDRGPDAPSAPTDRIYVGDFLIGIDGPGGDRRAGRPAQPARLHAGEPTSASRRLPVPPPPPPPARGGSSAARLPDEDEDVDAAARTRKSAGLAARPPRAGRAIPPPPPPPPPPPAADAARQPVAGARRRGRAVRDGAPRRRASQTPRTPATSACSSTRRRGRRRRRRRLAGASRPGTAPAWAAAPSPQAPAFGGATGPVGQTRRPDASGGGAAPASRRCSPIPRSRRS